MPKPLALSFEEMLAAAAAGMITAQTLRERMEREPLFKAWCTAKVRAARQKIDEHSRQYDSK